ncbi:biotin--[acetyl-CoA-carboxylase] ligase [Clostridium sp. MB40-C1]|uniref:biotin--[acetyl-CoA-carboxylase] ligase n=1 Tax=Clostridium sp. MB40-C1 TaxID=3070996 RepID=UPI0027DF1BAD|nr:biotin--[acetyl-CoA-carboxylase] ligase [Clostridium sp. MB40-C1]WMJ80107.1 biotin--[acetyl-CoA-carboxylase] ligase [Clostridium sp. MB40-C1]
MKEKIIELLKQNKNNFISGQKISESLGVSRAAIWKYINSIKEDGYKIESVSRKGYKLVSSPDLLTFEEIKDTLNTKYIGRNIVYLESVDSTNNEAKKLANKDVVEGTVVIAEEQIMGKGRLGRNFISPKYKGIWMSIILTPDINPMNVPKITQVAAASVIMGLKKNGIKAFVKWPNDIVINGKKICGILTEMSGEINKVNYVIVGIGINVNVEEDEFTEEIRDIASSLKIQSGKTINRKEVVSSVLNYFEELYEEFVTKENIDTSIKICRESSILLGKEIKIIERNNKFLAKALNLSNEGRLIIQHSDGKVEEIMSGEVSVRGINGYI